MTLDGLNAKVGAEVGVSEWFTVGQEHIDAFAEATEDRQWIHVDVMRASRESPYGGTVAHGFLTLSLLSHLSQDVPVVEGMVLRVNYGMNRVRFPAPVRADSRIRARFVLLSLKSFAKGRDATFGVTVEVEGSSKPCCVAEWIIRYYAA